MPKQYISISYITVYCLLSIYSLLASSTSSRGWVASGDSSLAASGAVSGVSVVSLRLCSLHSGTEASRKRPELSSRQPGQARARASL